MIVNGPELWRKILAGAPAGSVIMGGAIVDYVLGIQPKDFDVYCPIDAPFPLGTTWKLAGNPADYKEYQDVDFPIKSICNYTDHGVKIQLMQTYSNDPTKVFKHFDHSLTKGLYSKKGIFVSDCVYKTLETGEVRFVGKTESVEKRYKSLLRAHAKIAKYDPQGFDNWKFINF